MNKDNQTDTGLILNQTHYWFKNPTINENLYQSHSDITDPELKNANSFKISVLEKN